MGRTRSGAAEPLKHGCLCSCGVFAMDTCMVIKAIRTAADTNDKERWSPLFLAEAATGRC